MSIFEQNLEKNHIPTYEENFLTTVEKNYFDLNI